MSRRLLIVMLILIACSKATDINYKRIGIGETTVVYSCDPAEIFNSIIIDKGKRISMVHEVSGDFIRIEVDGYNEGFKPYRIYKTTKDSIIDLGNITKISLGQFFEKRLIEHIEKRTCNFSK